MNVHRADKNKCDENCCQSAIRLFRKIIKWEKYDKETFKSNPTCQPERASCKNWEYIMKWSYMKYYLMSIWKDFASFYQLMQRESIDLAQKWEEDKEGKARLQECVLHCTPNFFWSSWSLAFPVLVVLHPFYLKSKLMEKKQMYIFSWIKSVLIVNLSKYFVSNKNNCK
jgi:hypothetical protein